MAKKKATVYLYKGARGKLKFCMTNDYLFRMVLQRDKETLIRLICSVLHLKREDVISAIIDNPIAPGATIENKEYQLDIVVILNNNTTVTIEMQIVDYHNWPIRSLAYICRKFDNVARGEDYNKTEAVYQISFLDFTLFDDHPEFFAKYQVRNAKDGYLYTDRFNMFVVDLKQTKMATDEDRLYGIDRWARLFKAKTWEEIKMIVKEDTSMNSTAEAIYKSVSDQRILEQCRIREDNIAHEKYQLEQLRLLKRQVTSKDAIIADKEATIIDMGTTIADRDATIADQKATIVDMGATIADKDSTIAALQARLAKYEND